MTNFNFTDRASYLAWRAEWKANYAQLTTDIRRLKGERAETNRAWSKAITSGSNHCETAAEWGKFRLALTALVRTQRDAKEALEVLKEAKSVSSDLRDARIAAETASKGRVSELREPALI
jgi:hypothetical protein